MTEDTLPPRRSLATFLRGRPERTEADTAPAPQPALQQGAPVPAPESAPVTTAAASAEAEVESGHWPAAESTADVAAATASDTPLHIAAHHLQPLPAPGSVTPSFLRRRDRPGSTTATPRWQWLLIAMLGALLLLQVAVADRARLAAQAGSRPLIETLCGVLHCTLPPWHEPAAFSMLNRDIRPLPGHPGVLQVQASFRNDARWAQAWPVLRLALSDADGRVIARRRFAPDEYLGAAYEPAQTLAPRQSAQVSFHVREPASATVAFSFDFQ